MVALANTLQENTTLKMIVVSSSSGKASAKPDPAPLQVTRGVIVKKVRVEPRASLLKNNDMLREGGDEASLK